MKLISLLALFISVSSFAKDRVFVVVNHEYEGTKQWLPGVLYAEKGDNIKIKLINNTPSGVHGFEIADFKIKESIKKGETKEVSFIADKAGIFDIKCHLHAPHVGGQLVIVEPAMMIAPATTKK